MSIHHAKGGFVVKSKGRPTSKVFENRSSAEQQQRKNDFIESTKPTGRGTNDGSNTKQ